MFREVRFGKQILVVLGWDPRVFPLVLWVMPAVSRQPPGRIIREDISRMRMGPMHSDMVTVVKEIVRVQRGNVLVDALSGYVKQIWGVFGAKSACDVGVCRKRDMMM